MVHHETGVPAQVLETELNTICKINWNDSFCKFANFSENLHIFNKPQKLPSRGKILQTQSTAQRRWALDWTWIRLDPNYSKFWRIWVGSGL